jgi:hypothetical protein
MSTTSSRTIQIEFSGDADLNLIQSALDNEDSPGMSVIQTLTIGDNTITAPVVSGIVVSALTIIPPAANTSLITLKGVAGDTGIGLHLTDPSSIALDIVTPFTSLVLSAAAEIVGVRLIWS